MSLPQPTKTVRNGKPFTVLGKLFVANRLGDRNKQPRDLEYEVRFWDVKVSTFRLTLRRRRPRYFARFKDEWIKRQEATTWFVVELSWLKEYRTLDAAARFAAEQLVANDAGRRLGAVP